MLGIQGHPDKLALEHLQQFQEFRYAIFLKMFTLQLPTYLDNVKHLPSQYKHRFLGNTLHKP